MAPSARGKIHSIVAHPEQPVSDVEPREPKKAKREPVNWAKVEPHYRAGIRSLKELGKEFGCSDAAIVKHAAKAGWVRDLGAQVRAKADAKVSAAAVSAEVSVANRIQESVVVEAESQLQFQVRMTHRKDIARSRDLMSSLMSELEQQTANLEDFERLGELLDETDVNSNGKVIKDTLNAIYQKVISTPGRVDAAKKLVEILEKTIRLEREAFGIDNGDREKDSVETFLERIAKKRGIGQ